MNASEKAQAGSGTPLQVFEVVWVGAGHGASRLIDHIASRPRPFSCANADSLAASAVVKSPPGRR
ncbi:MAG: hypothetical protein ACRDPE_22435 [Solirubrobacterales bacterium]